MEDRHGGQKTTAGNRAKDRYWRKHCRSWNQMEPRHDENGGGGGEFSGDVVESMADHKDRRK